MKNKRITYFLIFMFSVILIPACIDEYTPNVEDELSDLLVVEGTISDYDNTIIKLSRSVKLSDTETFNPVQHAKVYVERSDGWESEFGVEVKSGEYHLNVGALDTSFSYSLVISLDGVIYRSIPDKPLITPEIDSVSWKQKGEGQPVSIYVTTHNNEENVGYYRWSYKEDWEIKANLFANASYDVSKDIYTPYSLKGLNTYYCWNKDSSRVLILGDTEKLSGNLIYEKELTTIEASHDKLSYLYSIFVKQWSVSKSAYNYFWNVQNNIDETGSIFAPQPAELKGNIECVTHPEEHVIGYVDVATITTKRIYISRDEIDYWDLNPICKILEAKGKAAAIDTIKKYGYVLLSGDEAFNNVQLTSRSCVDCRIKGSKTRPDFWPNDHQ